jgi:hypothetical protein
MATLQYNETTKKYDTVPTGWDAQTYTNFKTANPTLEPTAEDTAIMNGTYSNQKPLDATQLGQGSTFKIPEQDPGLNVASYVNSWQQMTNDANKITQPYQDKVTQSQKDLVDAQNAEPSQYQLYQNESAKAGIPDITKQLQEMNLQISQKTNQFNKSINDIGDQTIPMGFITGQQASVRQRAASEIGALASVQQALQGNLALARQTASDAVNMQFADAENKIKHLQSALDMNKDNLSTAEKKRAEQLQYTLTQRQTALDQQKADKTTILGYAQSAAQNGADNLTINKILSAKNPNEALLAAGNTLATNKFSITKIGVDDNGNDVYGTLDANTGKVVPIGTQSVVNNPSVGIVGGYDISSYATDPQHESKVSKILANIGQFKTLQDVQNYINKVAPGSPVTAEMISKASEKYGVSWEMLVAMMQQDSSLGTKGYGARTMNPGNVGTTDLAAATNTPKNYKSWQDGVDAVGAWLSSHKASAEQINSAKIQTSLKPVGDIVISRLPGTQQKGAKAALNNIVKNGDEQAVKEYIATTALDSANADQKTQQFGRLEALGALDQIQTLLQQYKATGGDTGLLTGTEEQIKNKLGKTKDPNLAIINNQILMAFQQYRRAMTGVAFSPAETAEYAKIFPGIGKEENWNDASMTSVKATMLRNSKLFYDTALGGSANTKAVFGDAFDVNLALNSKNFSINTPNGSVDLNSFEKNQ